MRRLLLIGCFLCLFSGNIWAESSYPSVRIVDRGFIIDRKHKEGPREVGEIPVEQVDSSYTYEWDFDKTARMWVYANAWMGDVEAWLKGTYYVDFEVTGLPQGYTFIAPQIIAKIKCFGLVDSFGIGMADTNYKIEIKAGLKENIDYNWADAVRNATIFAETDKETWKSWDFVAEMTTAAAGAVIGEIPVVGDVLDIVWQVAETAWDAIDCEAKIAKRGWVRFINIPIQAGKRYRIFLSNDMHVKAAGIGTGSRSIKIDFFKKAPFFTKETKNLSGWGFGIENVEVIFPQSVYDYLNQQAQTSAQQTEVIQQEVKPDLYFPQRPKIYPSSQITEKDTAQLEVFLTSKNKKVERAKVKVEIAEIGWQKNLFFSSLNPYEEYSQKVTLPKLTLPSGLNSKGYRIDLTIDPEIEIKEITRANNEDFVYIEVIPEKHQLEAYSVSVEPVLNQYWENDIVTIKGVVENHSNVDLDNIEVGFYYNAKDPRNIDLREIARKEVSLKKREKKTVYCRWKIKKSDSFWTEIYFIADPRNKIKEQDESQSIHEAGLGIRVKKQEITEKPVEVENLASGIDLSLDSKDIFLDKVNLIASNYLGVWVKNLGKEKADCQLKFTGYWIEKNSQGKGKIKTAVLGNLGGYNSGGKSKLYKFYYKNSPHKNFIFSKNLKIVVEAKNPQDRDTSNNIAVFRIGDFDGVAKQIREEKQKEQEAFSEKPDLAIIDIRNIEPPLKIGKERTFQVVIENVSNINIKEANIDCVIRPKGSGRPHPELGWRSYKKHIAPINAGTKTSVYIDYTPVRKGIYEIIAKVGSIRFKDWKIWQKDADKSNDSLLKYFGVEASMEEASGEVIGVSSAKLDLAVTDIWIDNKTPNVGEVITGGFVVHNYSQVSLKNIDWIVYSNNNNKVAEGKIPSMGANTSFTVTAQAEADKEGIFTVRAVVDPYNKIKEINENNNDKEIKLGIEEESLISLPQVDLAVMSLRLGKSTLKAGEATKATVQVKNLGKDTAYAVAVSFQVNGKTFFVNVIDELKSGQTKNISAPLVGLLGGSYTVSVRVDKKNLIKELNEDNNEKSATLRVNSPVELPHIEKKVKDIFNIFRHQ